MADVIPVGWETARFQSQLTKLALYVPRRQAVLWMSNVSTSRSSTPRHSLPTGEIHSTGRGRSRDSYFHALRFFPEAHLCSFFQQPRKLGLHLGSSVRFQKLLLMSLI